MYSARSRPRRRHARPTRRARGPCGARAAPYAMLRARAPDPAPAREGRLGGRAAETVRRARAPGTRARPPVWIARGARPRRLVRRLAARCLREAAARDRTSLSDAAFVEKKERNLVRSSTFTEKERLENDERNTTSTGRPYPRHVPSMRMPRF